MSNLEDKVQSTDIHGDDTERLFHHGQKTKKMTSNDEGAVDKSSLVGVPDTDGPSVAEVEEDPMAMFFNRKKKSTNKKRFKSKVDFSAFEDKEIDDMDGESWTGSKQDYTYTELLSRVFRSLCQNNPELLKASERKPIKLMPPTIVRDSSNKKTLLTNLIQICQRIHRPAEHVIQFLLTELGTSGSIDGKQCLVIKGRFQERQIEVVLKRYIGEYVQCKSCHLGDTVLDRERRVVLVCCQACGSTRAVEGIRRGFRALTGKRARAGAAATVG